MFRKRKRVEIEYLQRKLLKLQKKMEAIQAVSESSSSTEEGQEEERQEEERQEDSDQHETVQIGKKII